jgi:c-di-GMP-binding flagellar brake protein YcgR
LEGIYVKADQRQRPRYRIREMEFHVFSHGTEITGRLVNIGEGGLAFQSASGLQKKTKCRVIDILGPGPDRLYISRINCRPIYDIVNLSEGGSFTGTANRLCGLQFIDLTDIQAKKLTDLIDRHGVELKTIP